MFADYTVYRVVGPLWRWDVRYQDGSHARGFALGGRVARWAARTRIRNAQVEAEPMGPSEKQRRA